MEDRSFGRRSAPNCIRPAKSPSILSWPSLALPTSSSTAALALRPRFPKPIARRAACPPLTVAAVTAAALARRLLWPRRPPLLTRISALTGNTPRRRSSHVAPSREQPAHQRIPHPRSRHLNSLLFPTLHTTTTLSRIPTPHDDGRSVRDPHWRRRQEQEAEHGRAEAPPPHRTEPASAGRLGAP